MFLPQERSADIFRHLLRVIDVRNIQIMRMDKTTLLEWPKWTNGSSYVIRTNIVKMRLLGDVAIQMQQESDLLKETESDGPNYYVCHTLTQSDFL